MAAAMASRLATMIQARSMKYILTAFQYKTSFTQRRKDKAQGLKQ
jgi:hypothetical protein